jgi:predicted transcriptional regulator
MLGLIEINQKVDFKNSFMYLINMLLGFEGTKQLILESLLDEERLSAKEIYHRVRRNSERQISYQAVHKILLDLVLKKVLNRDGSSYFINYDWILGLNEFISKFNDKKINTEPKAEIFLFDTYTDFAKFIISVIYRVSSEDGESGVCLMKHAWPVPIMGKDDCDLLVKLLKEHEYYDVTEKDTPLDRAFAKTLERLGKKVKIGVKTGVKYDILCKGEHIFEIYFEGNEMEKVYKKHSCLDDYAMNDIIQRIIIPPTQIRVVHIVSGKRSKLLREKIKKIFN